MKSTKEHPSGVLRMTGKAREKVQRTTGIRQYVRPIGVVRNPNRKITVTANMFVLDDETFGSDETTSRQQTNSAILSTNGIAQTVMDFEVRMGGEIRVEFMVTASLIDNAGNAQIDCDVKLFEGTTESTTDLDGEKEFHLYCPVGASINHFVRVDNDDEGGDYVTIRMNILNQDA